MLAAGQLLVQLLVVSENVIFESGQVLALDEAGEAVDQAEKHNRVVGGQFGRVLAFHQLLDVAVDAGVLGGLGTVPAHQIDQHHRAVLSLHLRPNQLLTQRVPGL